MNPHRLPDHPTRTRPDRRAGRGPAGLTTRSPTCARTISGSFAIFQTFNLDPGAARRSRTWSSRRRSACGTTTEGGRKALQALEPPVGCATLAGHRPDELSGGQRQRCRGRARALWPPTPALVLADEPTANSDSAHRARPSSTLAARHHRRARHHAVHLLDPRPQGDGARAARGPPAGRLLRWTWGKAMNAAWHNRMHVTSRTFDPRRHPRGRGRARALQSLWLGNPRRSLRGERTRAPLLPVRART